MKYSFCLAASLLISAAPFAHAEQDAAPVDVNTILSTLKTIQKQTTDNSKAEKTKLAQQFLSLSRDTSGAISYYEEATRATKFEGESREGTQFQQWKTEQDARMKGKPFRDGLSLHLLYLGLTLERSSGMEVKALIPDLISYTQQVMAAQDSGAPPPPPVIRPPWGQQGRRQQQQQASANPATLDDEWVKQALTSSIFVKWLQISSYVSSVQDWEMTPGNVDGIYAKTILPEFRRVKDPRVLEYWDMRMTREAAQASASGRNFDMDKYNQVTMPNLLWSRAQEYLALDQKNRGITEMVKLIKSYPTHPSVPDWISQVQQILQPPAVAPEAAPTAAVANPAAAPGASPATASPTPVPVNTNIPATLLPGQPTPSAPVPAQP